MMSNAHGRKHAHECGQFEACALDDGGSYKYWYITKLLEQQTNSANDTCRGEIVGCSRGLICVKLPDEALRKTDNKTRCA